MAKNHDLVQNKEQKITFVFRQKIINGYSSISMSCEPENNDDNQSGSLDFLNKYFETIFELFCRSKLSDFTLLDWLYIKILKLFIKNVHQSECKVILSFPNFPRFNTIHIEYKPRLFFLEHSVRTRFVKYLEYFIFSYEEEMQRRKKNKKLFLSILYLNCCLYISYFFYSPFKAFWIEFIFLAVFIWISSKIFNFFE